jgi:CheY-like chemotaxis protein/DNA-binding CsgD family transcriptional regulator
MTNLDWSTILIVDDQIENLQTIVGFMLSAGFKYKLLSATNGKIACEIAITEKPDLILMDWDMPVMNGIEAAQFLKNQESTKDIPVIITTGVMISTEDLNMALSAGAVDFIRKPIDKIELIARTTSALRLSNSIKHIKNQNLKIEQQLELLNASEQRYQLIAAQLQNELSHRNQELVSKAMQLVSNNKFLMSLIDNLKAISLNSPEQSKKIQMLITEINHYSNNDTWKEFEVRFEMVYPQFLNNLSKKFPDLTTNEKKLCVFLSLNMSTKDIASITMQDINAIRVARTRLRKKLGISTDDNISSFLAVIE